MKKNREGCPYKCSSADDPIEAISLCTQQGCESFAFMCGQKGCSCIKPHIRHHHVSIEWVLSDVKRPLQLPEQLTKSEKAFNSLIENCMKKLEQLAVKNKELIQRHLSIWFVHDNLRAKLDRREPLKVQQATGDQMRRLLMEISPSRILKNPYLSPSMQFESLAKQAADSFQEILKRIKNLWDTPYIFSKELKSDLILLKENRSKAFQTTSSSTLIRNICLVQPSLSKAVPSKATFKISTYNNAVGLGICLKDVVKANEYNCNMSNIKHGCYMLMQNRDELHHTDEFKNNISGTGKGYSNGQAVTVEFNPTTGKVTYKDSKQNILYEQPTGLTKAEKSDIHFCVLLQYQNEEVTLVVNE